ncbi:hypothetical protein [Agrobacterium tumefaciens]|uniref:hypothetical protein n=1 Tax=Agrobacterium tumefaciens TaxID=358 RepID=UPI0009D05674|nr:hypothetical protein [Agrobacterium tumefaciens]WIC86813.1 hypothetical protein A6U93_18225 [Agrobacterium tumefaciens]CUX00851.1 conserved hypothetical protein [Agrobacterium fabacearum S56]
MRLLSVAIGMLSVGILSGCVDDSGYRSGGYYASSVQYRSNERERYYRDYDRRNYNRRDYVRRDRDRHDYVRPEREPQRDPSGNSREWIDQGGGRGYERAVVNGQVIYRTGKDVQ